MAETTRPKHFSMIREMHLADVFTLGNAACGVGAVFCAMIYLAGSDLRYFYAAAAQVTYERVMDTIFIFERQEKDGRWMILAHQSGSYGIAPGEATNPMPDLRKLYYATKGKDRDPDADARKAKEF